MSAMEVGQAAYAIDGRAVPRATFYAAACHPGRSVAVEACAGAGKTWMLVSRILRALLDGAQPQDILAITFTRKAAGEMRARLDEWLAEFGAPTCSDDARVQALRDRGMDDAQARANAPLLAGLHERLLRSGRAVEVRTFHAWFSQLLRAAPLELLASIGLQPDMELLEDPADHRDAVYRRFHAAVLRNESLREDFDTMVRERGRFQLRKWLDAAWDKRIEIELADAAGRLEASVPPAASHWPAFARFEDPSGQMATDSATLALTMLSRELGALKGAVARRQAALLEQSLSIEPPPARLAAVRAALYTNDGALRKGLDAPSLMQVAALVEEVVQACAQQAAHEEHRRMVRLARALFAEYEAYKRARGFADMADLERCALAILRDSTLAAWMQERLDARVRHLLIDEFQDTSPLQWHALHAWLSGYAGAGGGASGQRPPSVFIVGDPKQSIYRFRRAEPRVFEAAREFIVEGLDGSVLTCDHTRRNSPAVLRALNGVFEQARDGGEFDGFRRHTTEVDFDTGGVFVLPAVERPERPRNGTPVRVAWRDTLTDARHSPEEELRQQEARLVAHAIGDLVATGRAQPGNIQVLCRKRESLRLVGQALAEVHLPFAAPEDFPLIESPQVRDLLAVLDAIVSPQHKLSLAHALRSPLFGARDEDLVVLAAEAAEHGDWWRALREMPAPAAFLQRALELLTRWRIAAQKLPPHDLVDAIVEEGELRERVAAVVPPERRNAALHAIDALLGQALTLDGARYATPYNFVRALRRRAVDAPATLQPSAVQLLTVHGAKGLEADVVFVMDSEPEPRASETATLLVDWPVAEVAPRRCAFIYAESRCPPSLAATQALEEQARDREELNALYVAMTRARVQLVFSSTAASRPAPRTPWRERVLPWCLPFPQATQAEVPAIQATATSDSITLHRLPHWAGEEDAAAAATATTAPSPSDDASSRLGQAVHRALEWAASAAGEAGLHLFAGAAAEEFGADASEVLRLAELIWNSPSCARFFAGPQLRWAGNEVAVGDGRRRVAHRPSRGDRGIGETGVVGP